MRALLSCRARRDSNRTRDVAQRQLLAAGQVAIVRAVSMPRLLIPVKKFIRTAGWFSGPDAPRFFRDATLPGDEAYRISITPKTVDIFYRSDAGVFYARQTLRELRAACGSRLPACQIEDAPDFARRGVYLDCSRGRVPTIATLKWLVELLARWKINELQLYIENVFTWRKHPTIGRGYSPFTPNELLAVQEHCRKHFIRFVPSLASFGHMERILALPRYRHLAELPGFHGLPGGTTLCPGDPGALKLIADLYAEFLPLFDAVDFNACCDETWELGQGRSKRRAARLGTGRVYLDFILQLHRLCAKYGKRMNIWGDIVLKHPELIPLVPKDIVMLNWEYSASGGRIPRTREFVAAGLPVMVCPGTSSWLSHGTRLANAIANVNSFAAVGRRYGVEGLLNTDWGDCGHRQPLTVSLHGFAHGAAHAWNGAAVQDATFTKTFCHHVFGDERWADALRALGSSEPTSTAQDRFADTILYRTLVAPLQPGADFCRGMDRPSPARVDPAAVSHCVDIAEPARLEAVVERLGGMRFPADQPELALAAQMDVLAARRTLLAKRYRAGAKLRAAELRRWADDARQLRTEFRRCWLARHKPSRLADNLHLFDQAIAECYALA